MLKRMKSWCMAKGMTILYGYYIALTGFSHTPFWPSGGSITITTEWWHPYHIMIV